MTRDMEGKIYGHVESTLDQFTPKREFEGGDWDQKFPETARSRIEGLRKVFRSMDRATAKQAKASPFPSKGGESSLTSGKTGGYKTPEERTNELWPMLNPGQTE